VSLIGATVDNRQRRIAVPFRTLTRAAERALRALGREGGGVEIMLVDDTEIRRLNRVFRGVGRRTDVLAFPLEVAEAPGGLVGQVVISVDTARRQARRLGVPLGLELQLLVTHGVLHLIGYDDRDPIEAHLMHRRERELLSAGRTPLPRGLWRGLLNA
jgi:probable rRNA maturation factor